MKTIEIIKKNKNKYLISFTKKKFNIILTKLEAKELMQKLINEFWNDNIASKYYKL